MTQTAQQVVRQLVKELAVDMDYPKHEVDASDLPELSDADIAKCIYAEPWILTDSMNDVEYADLFQSVLCKNSEERTQALGMKLRFDVTDCARTYLASELNSYLESLADRDAGEDDYNARDRARHDPSTVPTWPNELDF